MWFNILNIWSRIKNIFLIFCINVIDGTNNLELLHSAVALGLGGSLLLGGKLMSKKIDLRVLKTHESIKNAFSNILLKKILKVLQFKLSVMKH